uniref:Amino acid transporter transmembrane domain-containing protein n=1 Tax=Zea mays TaxID=4577 RepID=A0A804UL05_MAIZE
MAPAPHNGLNNNHPVAPMDVSVEAGNAGAAEWLDDDGRPRRSGTFWTASAHIITAVIGSGVLSLAWAIAQLGWVAGPAAMLLFAFVTYYTAALLAECYRTGHPETGKRNYTYMDAVRSNLGGVKVVFCGVIQYANLVGVAIGYTIASAISMKAVRRAGCFHAHGHADPCKSSSTPYMVLFGGVQILFSQIPDFDQIWWLSIVAAVMSFTYSSIGLSLGIAQTVSNGGFKGSLTGISIGAGVTSTQKIWHTLQAFGDIAFAYSFSNILIEIQVSSNCKQSPLHLHCLCSVSSNHVCSGPSGYDQGAATVGVEGDAEGDAAERGDHDSILHAVRVHGVRGVRRQRAGQPPHRLRLLRALLAARRRQRGHRRAPGRRLPGVLPAHLRLRGAPRRRGLAGQRLRLPGAPRGSLLPQRVPPDVAVRVRVRHHRRRHAAAVLRRRGGAPRRRLLLAAHRLLPRRNVHQAAPRAPRQHQVDLPPDAQRQLSPCLRRRCSRIHCRCHRRPQGLQAVQRLASQAEGGRDICKNDCGYCTAPLVGRI